MTYEISVAFQKKHFFATHARSINTHEHFLTLFIIFNERFPRCLGYEVTGSVETRSGKNFETLEQAQKYFKRRK